MVFRQNPCMCYTGRWGLGKWEAVECNFCSAEAAARVEYGQNRQGAGISLFPRERAVDNGSPHDHKAFLAVLCNYWLGIGNIPTLFPYRIVLNKFSEKELWNRKWMPRHRYYNTVNVIFKIMKIIFLNKLRARNCSYGSRLQVNRLLNIILQVFRKLCEFQIVLHYKE